MPIVNLKYEYICVQCGKPQKSNQRKTKLCSRVCRIKFSGRHSVVKELGISSGTAGAMTELRVSVFLMEKGYSLFRSLSPSCFCDIIAIKEKEIMYLEVRTGYISANGNFNFPKVLHIKTIGNYIH